MEPRLEDQFEFYPDADDPEIQRKIAEKYEFAECASGRRDEKLPGDDFFTQQRLYQRIGYVYDRLAFLAEAGVGKTLGETCLAEYLKTHDLSSTKAYFITGKGQIEDVKKQLIYGYASSPYLTEKVKSYKTASKGLNKVISNTLKAYYKIKTYGSFLNELKSLIQGMSAEEANAAIREKYSGCYFFFDEIQSLKITPGQTQRPKQRHYKYWLLWRLCHVVQRSRITIASARPHTNTIQEFAYAMNLILPVENQILVDPSFQSRPAEMGFEVNYGPEVDWDIRTLRKQGFTLEEISDYYLEVLEPYLNGRIVFVAAPETGIELSYLPLEQPTAPKADQERIAEMREAQMKRQEDKYAKLTSRLRFLEFATLPDGSLDLQGETYRNYLETKNRKTRNFEDKTQREILTFTFPHSRGLVQNWGSQGEKHWLTRRSDGSYTYKEGVKPLEEGKDLRWYLENSLRSCSVKMWYIRNQAVNYPWKGYSFFDFVQGGGTNLFGLVLEEGGPVWMKDRRSNQSFKRYNPRERDLNYRNIKAGELERYIPKAPRYAIITGEIQSGSDMFNILDLYNHPDNVYGEFIKHIIISKRGQVGTNLTATRYVNSFFLAHNPADLYQAIRRAIRATSHIQIVRLWHEEHPDEPFEVEINLMVCLFPVNAKFEGSQNTVDSKIAVRTFEKDLNTSCITRAYKRLSMAAWVLDERNTLDHKYDFQAECDYMRCEMQYVTKEPSGANYDYSTYLLMYAGYEIDREAEAMLAQLQEEGSFSLLRYVDEKYGYAEPQRSIAFLAAASIIDNSITGTIHNVKDRYGFTCKVIEKEGTMYLNRKNFIVPQGPFTSYYTQNLIAIKTRNIEEILEERFLREVAEVWRVVEDYGEEMLELSVFLNQLNNNVKALFLESLIQARLENKTVPENYTTILAIFAFDDIDVGNLININEPLEALEKISNSRDNKYEIPIVPSPEGCDVYVHNIYVFEQTKAKAGATGRAMKSIGRLRIRSAKESAWRDTNWYETIAYRKLFQEKVAKIELNMYEKGVYGQVLENQRANFFIVDKTATNELTNGRQDHRGCVCSEIGNKVKIIMYMWYVGMRPNVAYLQSITDVPVKEKARALHEYREGQPRKLKKGEKLTKQEEARLGRHINRFVRFPNVVYTFKTLKKAERAEAIAQGLLSPDEELMTASEDMVHFFYHYLMGNQSKRPKSAPCSELAMFMYHKGLVISPTLNRYQILEILQEQQRNSFLTAKESKNRTRR